MYQDELLISILKRYYARTANKDSGTTLIELFGTRHTSIHTHMPTNLDTLISNIPLRFNIKGDDFIEKHTLFNYYTAFSSDEVKIQIREKMMQSKGEAFKATKYEDIPLNKYLRYCPKCVQEAFDDYGEFHWNRIHQVSFVCTKHQEFLVESTYEIGGKDLTYHVPYSNVVSFKNKEDVIFFEKLFRISERIEVLVRGGSDMRHEDLKIVYYKELDKRGFIYKSKQQVYIKELEQEIINYFGKQIIEKITGKSNLAWVARLLGNYVQDMHPIYHVLMQELLELDNKKIVKAIQEVKQEQQYLEEKGVNTEEGNPLLFSYLCELMKLDITCKNPLGRHYQKEQIINIKLTYGDVKKDMMCTFECSCGHTYTTAFEDLVKSEGQAIGMVKEWGPVYEEELIKNKHLGIKGITRLTGVNHGTIRKQLRNYETYGTIRGRNKQEEKVTVQNKIQGQRAGYDYKEEWLKKDEMYYEKVKELLEQERHSMDKPKWITKTWVGKQIGATYAIVYNLDKLSRTRTLIEDNVISKEEWIKRKVIWAIRRMNEDEEEILTWKVIKKAALASDNFKKIDNIVKEVKERTKE